MNKLEQTRKKGVTTLIAISIIGVAVYLGFDPLFDRVGGGVAGAVVGASFGAIFVIVLTMYLLNKQTEIEQESKKGERVFDEKVILYKEILITTENMVEDGVIAADEVTKLPFTLMKLQMLGGDEAIASYQKVYSKINAVFGKDDSDQVAIDEVEKLAIYKEMMKFTVQCRVDLGISDIIVDEKLFEKTINTIEKSSELVEVRGGGDAKAVYRTEADFFEKLEERGFETNVIDIAKKIYERLQQEFGKHDDYDVNLVATSETSTPQISIRKDDGTGKMNKFGGCEIRKKSLITGCWRSPRWNYKQIKVGNLIFGHAKKFSFEDNKLVGGPAKYMPILSSNAFDSISADELNGYIVVLKESIKVREQGTRIKYRELVNKAESGDQEAIEKLKQIISVNYLHELTADEIASAAN